MRTKELVISINDEMISYPPLSAKGVLKEFFSNSKRRSEDKSGVDKLDEEGVGMQYSSEGSIHGDTSYTHKKSKVGMAYKRDERNSERSSIDETCDGRD